jgi:hypothetical protein
MRRSLALIMSRSGMPSTNLLILRCEDAKHPSPEGRTAGVQLLYPHPDRASLRLRDRPSPQGGGIRARPLCVLRGSPISFAHDLVRKVCNFSGSCVDRSRLSMRRSGMPRTNLLVLRCLARIGARASKDARRSCRPSTPTPIVRRRAPNNRPSPQGGGFAPPCPLGG